MKPRTLHLVAPAILAAALVGAAHAESATSAGAPRSEGTTTTSLQNEFQARAQALFDAIAIGDKAIWDRTLDRDCVITSEDGEVLDKAKFLADLHPLPKGFIGRGTIRDLTTRILDHTAIIHYWIDEQEDIFTQELRTTYVETDTYARRGKDWKIVAMQLTVVPRDLPPLTNDTTEWPRLIGDYGFPGSHAAQFRVFRHGDTLLAGKDEQSAVPLVPLSPLVFYQKGSIHLYVFVKDAAGAIAEVRELHKYNAVRFERLSGGTAGR